MIGAAAGAMLQLISMVYLKHVLPSESFNLYVLATALALSSSTVALLNRHVNILRDSAGQRELTKRAGRSAAVFGALAALIAINVGHELAARTAFVFVACVSAGAYYNVHAQIWIASFVRDNLPKKELFGRAANQMFFLAAVIVLQPAQVEVLFLIQILVGLFLCVVLGAGGKSTKISAHAVQSGNADSPKQQIVFTTHVISDAIVGPLLIVIWTTSFSANFAADILFVYRLLGGMAGVIAGGISLHIAKYSSERESFVPYRIVSLSVIGVWALLVVWAVVEQIRELTDKGTNQLTSHLLLYCNIIGWQGLVAVVGAVSMLPKLHGKQLQFSAFCLLYNCVLAISSYAGCYFAKGYLSESLRFTDSLLFPTLLIGVIFLWVLWLKAAATVPQIEAGVLGQNNQ